jgi:hypothetical protein
MKTLYELKRGKFVPVGVDWSDTLPPGNYVIRVTRNSRKMSTRVRKIPVRLEAVEVVMDIMVDAITDAIVQVDQLTPQVRKNTPREQQAFEAYKRIAGEETLTLSRKSATDVAQTAVWKIREKIRSQCPKGCLRICAERPVDAGI